MGDRDGELTSGCETKFYYGEDELGYAEGEGEDLGVDHGGGLILCSSIWMASMDEWKVVREILPKNRCGMVSMISYGGRLVIMNGEE